MANIPPERFLHLYDRGHGVQAIAEMYRVDTREVRQALDKLKIGYLPGQKPEPRKRQPVRQVVETFQRRPPVICDVEPYEARVWCDQCDRQVFETEARGCQSRFCKAKVAA